MGNAPTLVGEVQSVSGSTVSVRLRSGVPSLTMVEGQSYRVGQIGAMLRIPLGYAELYGICTQVGAAALPHPVVSDANTDGRWLTLTLVGESLGGRFERGVTQYPTFGDGVHLVTNDEVDRIYGANELSAPLTIGAVASGSGIDARLDLSRLVSRHSAVLGASGSGKSNLVSVMLAGIAEQGYPSARVLVFDPHGEYTNAAGGATEVFSISPGNDEHALHVPYWALPFEELMHTTLGELNSANESAIREIVLELKRSAALQLRTPPPPEALTADSPVPFSLKRLWFDLSDYEARTYADAAKQSLMPLSNAGDANRFVGPSYPGHSIGSGSPYKGPRREIRRQLDLLRSRALDSRYQFLFEPGMALTPGYDGATPGDLDQLVESWVGHAKPITVLDLSSAPSDVLSLVTGTVLRIVFDALYWAGSLSVSGRQRPLLIVIDEAHLFVPEGQPSLAQRIVAKIAKEGRKYGVGLMLVTQRPSEIDSTALSQCGTFFALRLTNAADQAKVRSTMPDDLAGLSSMLPALRTGEAIVTGEAVTMPTRVRTPLSRHGVKGADASVAEGWRRLSELEPAAYKEAIANWRSLRQGGGVDS